MWASVVFDEIVELGFERSYPVLRAPSSGMLGGHRTGPVVLPSVLEHATAEKLSVTATLERLLTIEVTATEARRLAGRLRFACLPSPATLEDFDYDAQPGADRALINELGTCACLESGTNVL